MCSVRLIITSVRGYTRDEDNRFFQFPFPTQPQKRYDKYRNRNGQIHTGSIKHGHTRSTRSRMRSLRITFHVRGFFTSLTPRRWESRDCPGWHFLTANCTQQIRHTNIPVHTHTHTLWEPFLFPEVLLAFDHR